MTERIIDLWTSDDEQALRDLQARKARLVELYSAPLRRIVDGLETDGTGDERIVKGLIDRADDVVAALRPFCTRT